MHLGTLQNTTDLQPLRISWLGRQDALNDTQNALYLVDIAVDGGGNLLGVQVLKPAALAKVRALPAHLEVQPLITEVALLQRAVRDAVVGGVVLLGQVLVDGTRLPEREASVGVFDRGDSPVWIDVYKRLLLNVVEAE